MKLRNSLKIALLALFALALALTWSVTSAQRDPGRDFPETGHSVSGDFLKFYESYPNAELVFGYPISRQFEDKSGETPRLVQYFQRARLELVAEGADGTTVVLSPLGEYLHTGQNPSLETRQAGCRVIQNPTTGEAYPVCYAFLDFFDTHGGLSLFGYPIAGFESENGYIVQYFDNAILSWHPEMPAGQKVQLIDVGSRYFYQFGEDREVLNPDNGGDVPGSHSLLSLKVRAFTESALVGEGEEQTLYVIVQDQKLQPVEGAQVKFILSLPDGETIANLMPPTDKNGVTQLSLPINTAGEVGPATFDVIASIFNLENTTRTSFRIWW